MARPSVFLRLKIYRRTFCIYLAIVVVFSVMLLSFFYRSVQATGQASFEADTALAFRETETKLQGVTRDIDAFITRLYANPALLEDFFQFFGSTPAQYAENRLRGPYSTGETYLDLCDSLAYTSNYTIRHIVYYSTNNLVEMEYGGSGSCRQKVIDMATAEALCQTGSVYTKDIHKDSAYVGKVSFILDVSDPVAAPFCTGKGQGVWLTIHGTGTPLGEPTLDISQVTGADIGMVGGHSRPIYYCAHTSEQFGFTAIYTAPATPYLTKPMSQFFLVAAGIILVFTLITSVLMRQFSRDADYLETILQSMEHARSNRYVPVDTQGRDDEFSSIAQHLNALYDHLQVLIQQKYELTIRQQQAQMDMLSAQLNPHFLYNTLERIRMRALQAGDTAVAEATADLGRLYRNIVKTEPIITIDQELEITRQYLDLMSFLYGDQFLYHCDVSEALGPIPTPKIWVQPIVENFFKNNFRNDDRMKIIVLAGERVDGVAQFRFFDNQGYIEPAKLQELNSHFTGDITDSSGIGLLNVYHRLRLFYGEGLKMAIRNCSPAGVCIEIQFKEEGKKDTYVPAADRG